MVLVDYSESGSSDEEPTVSDKKTAKVSTKPAFQKVVDRSNPHKIQVNLPSLSHDTNVEEDLDGQPPTKRAKAGPSAFSGFNALLPTPKRSAGTAAGQGSGGARKGGLGSGINLKTGAAPGFSREPEPVAGKAEKEENPGRSRDHGASTESTNGDQIPLFMEPRSVGEPSQEPKKQGSAMGFRPLSVARKPQKKKPAPTSGLGSQTSMGDMSISQSKKPQSISLFPTGDIKDEFRSQTNGNSVYEPIVYQPAPSDEATQNNPTAINPYIDNDTATNQVSPQETPPNPPPLELQSLDTIASDLNLSSSARRQLLGRQRNSSNQSPAVNIVTFNTEQEYKANNELLRQAGEQAQQQQHNPVRSIAPGKHSLQQLVNAVSNQKDALEEQFASGRRNKMEAGSKYGW
ncbi:MAG: hypothetical protein Q9190_007121 [Brigantiaea leucoxantha]